MNRHVVLSLWLLAALIAAVASGGATVALFSDEASVPVEVSTDVREPEHETASNDSASSSASSNTAGENATSDMAELANDSSGQRASNGLDSNSTTDADDTNDTDEDVSRT